MSKLTWVDYAQGVGALLTPLVAAGLVYVLSRRQSRSHELLSARLEYYRELVPDLNTLMCYMTFIGDWKGMSPGDAIALKRRLDKTFHCAAPLFSSDVLTTYSHFTDKCFGTFNNWGQDALLLTSAYRRRSAFSNWDKAWDAMFAYTDVQPIPAQELGDLRTAYDRLVAALVRDIDITRARSAYTTSAVSLNAHAPHRDDISGRPAGEAS